MISAWRLCKARFAATAFDGEGSRLNAARWNERGTAVIYTAGTPALAVLELRVHLATEADFLDHYVLINAEFDESLCKTLKMKDLPSDWAAVPPSDTTQRIGTQWAANGESAVLAVPSAVVTSETVYLLNPAHPDFRAVKIGTPRPFRFDPRLASLER